MSRRTIARRASSPLLALATVGLLAAAIAAPAAAQDEIQVTIGPGPDFVISHPTLTVEVGTILRYTKASSGAPYHVLEHIEEFPGMTYQQQRQACAQPGFTDCHWVDAVVTVAPPADIIGVPGPPPGGNGLFYGTTITSNPHSFLWDTGAWHDQHVVGYLNKPPITAPRTFWLVDALNSQIVQQRITIVPRGWVEPTTDPNATPTPTPQATVVAETAAPTLPPTDLGPSTGTGSPLTGLLSAIGMLFTILLALAIRTRRAHG